MNIPEILTRMNENAASIAGLASRVSDGQSRWKPSLDAWSLLEVINHLYDEEREDFRTRLDYTLHHQGESWPPIDPPGWVVERRYNERELAPSLDRFLQERRESLQWLEALVNPDWTLASSHPAIGRMAAGDVLASWLAHDFLHIRQLNELHYQYHARQVAPLRIDYAGDW